VKGLHLIIDIGGFGDLPVQFVGALVLWCPVNRGAGDWEQRCRGDGERAMGP